jgi:hypothetical protein
MPTDESPQWVHVHAPNAVIREPGADGLELQVRAMTVPGPTPGDFAVADVTTIAHGVEQRHGNVLISGDEPASLARFLEAALKSPREDRTASLFDDGMTFRIEGDSKGRWSVECHPVPAPPPDAISDTFPAFSFELGAEAMQRAIADLDVLSTALSTTRAGLQH